MEKILENFWKWLGITPYEYSLNISVNLSEKPEFYYPQYNELLELAKSIVDSGTTDHEKICDLLTIMAIDNESESVLEYIQHFSSIVQLNAIIDIGISHMQKAARWQTAELIFQKKVKNYMFYLENLKNDSDEYVRKRASNLLCKLQI